METHHIEGQPSSTLDVVVFGSPSKPHSCVGIAGNGPRQILREGLKFVKHMRREQCSDHQQRCQTHRLCIRLLQFMNTRTHTTPAVIPVSLLRAACLNPTLWIMTNARSSSASMKPTTMRLAANAQNRPPVSNFGSYT